MAAKLLIMLLLQQDTPPRKFSNPEDKFAEDPSECIVRQNYSQVFIFPGNSLTTHVTMKIVRYLDENRETHLPKTMSQGRSQYCLPSTLMEVASSYQNMRS
jgi:hypothetical protein